MSMSPSMVPFPWQYLPSVLGIALMLFLYCFILEFSLLFLIDLLAPKGNSWHWERGLFLLVLGILDSCAWLYLLEYFGNLVSWFRIKEKNEEAAEMRMSLSGQLPSQVSNILFMGVTVAVLGIFLFLVFVVTIFFMVPRFGNTPMVIREAMNWIAIAAVGGGVFRVLWLKTDVLGLVPRSGTSLGIGDDNDFTTPIIRVV
uniref:Uncharacterized protein n=1 Tax=Cyclophora tenuis TaxID=216820 RepID=A0A7S1D2G1_CYCTE|mmetsp:Transcript_18623/g.31797  ORF Transcript_18623/g.31797 Transcript_18623/m.31797 type:complete len:200 (+) Transcript_18623:271-870(+)